MLTLRPMEAELEGYAWLPRMLDKARATVAGDAEGFVFGCPVDHTCMARLGIEPELVLALVAEHGDDDAAVLAALRAQAIPPAEDAWFDGVAVEDELAEHDRYLRVRRAEQLPAGEHGRTFAGAEHGAPVTVTLLDAAPGAVHDWHEHATAEVLVVQAGRATIALGERQMRTVRAGEVVRIPAGVRHRLEVSGDAPLRGVAVLGAS